MTYTAHPARSHEREPGRGSPCGTRCEREPGRGSLRPCSHERGPGRGSVRPCSHEREPGRGSLRPCSHERAPGRGSLRPRSHEREPGRGSLRPPAPVRCSARASLRTHFRGDPPRRAGRRLRLGRLSSPGGHQTSFICRSAPLASLPPLSDATVNGPLTKLRRSEDATRESLTGRNTLEQGGSTYAGGRPGSECAARYERSNERGRGAAGSPDPALVHASRAAGSPDPDLLHARKADRN
jgi:hypothetical protein